MLRGQTLQPANKDVDVTVVDIIACVDHWSLCVPLLLLVLGPSARKADTRGCSYDVGTYGVWEECSGISIVKTEVESCGRTPNRSCDLCSDIAQIFAFFDQAYYQIAPSDS